jgi:hypothetical protein
LIARLHDLGFHQMDVKEALCVTNFDFSRAVEYLIDARTRENDISAFMAAAHDEVPVPTGGRPPWRGSRGPHPGLGRRPVEGNRPRSGFARPPPQERPVAEYHARVNLPPRRPAGDARDLRGRVEMAIEGQTVVEEVTPVAETPTGAQGGTARRPPSVVEGPPNRPVGRGGQRTVRRAAVPPSELRQAARPPGRPARPVSEQLEGRAQAVRVREAEEQPGQLATPEQGANEDGSQSGGSRPGREVRRLGPARDPRPLARQTNAQRAVGTRRSDQRTPRAAPSPRRPPPS